MFEHPLRLSNPLRYYAWGSPYVLPHWMGLKANGKPWAEMWMGAHPQGPSEVELSGSRIPLTELIKKYPETILGPGRSQWPFLFKVLAAEEPLSIQAHPNQAQAEAGFAREERLAIPADSPLRTYKDAEAKPEMIMALGDFVGLKGFRPVDQIYRHLSGLGLEPLMPELTLLKEESPLKNFFSAFWRLPKNRCLKILEKVDQVIAPDSSQSHYWVRELLRKYPGDISCLGPLFLNLFELMPGQALYLPAGQLHSYLGGLSLEVMGNSDNVVRGGLTQKHVDIDELVRILDFNPSRVNILEPEPKGQILHYCPKEAHFMLRKLVLDSSRIVLEREAKAEIVLCIVGEMVLYSGEHSLILSQGQSALLSAQVKKIEVSGHGQLCMASPV